MTVLLLGAAGKVGPHVAQHLVDANQTVRVLSRDPDRARQLLPEQVEMLGGVYSDIGFALPGVTAVLLLTEHGRSMAQQQLSLISQITDQRVRIVKISGTSAAIGPHGPDACRQHWRVEQALERGPHPWVVLRPNAFMQTLVGGAAAGIRATGSMTNPLGSAGISLIDTVDVGAVAAAALVEPALLGRTLVLTGPRAYTYQDIADAIGRSTGHQVEVVGATPVDVAEAIRARGGSDWDAAHLQEMLTIFRAGRSEYVTADVETVLHRAARTLDDFVHAHLADFCTAPAGV